MSRTKTTRWIGIAALALGAAAASAHPGHADPGTPTTLLHLLTEPDHLVMIVAAACAVAGLRLARRGNRRDQDGRR